MSVVILESDMKFGEYKENQVFRLETSIQYTKRLKSNGIKSCEFVLRRGRKLYFVEAKKSCPKQIQASTSEEKKEKYYEYIEEIVLKMKHSLALYSNILLQRYEADGVSELLRRPDLSEVQIVLVLVVKNAEKEWLIPFQDVIRYKLKDEREIWKVSNVFIINEETARKKHLVV